MSLYQHSLCPPKGKALELEGGKDSGPRDRLPRVRKLLDLLIPLMLQCH